MPNCRMFFPTLGLLYVSQLYHWKNATLFSSNILQFKAAGSYLPFFPLGFLESFSLPYLFLLILFLDL
jgi:hypothetical protein